MLLLKEVSYDTANQLVSLVNTQCLLFTENHV